MLQAQPLKKRKKKICDFTVLKIYPAFFSFFFFEDFILFLFIYF